MSVPIRFDADVLEFTKETYNDCIGYRKDLPPATAAWFMGRDGKPHALYFTCPCGCGQVGATPVHAASQGWSWNQSTDKPTLSPSIRMLGKCGWHGYLQNGNFNPC